VKKEGKEEWVEVLGASVGRAGMGRVGSEKV